MILDLLRKRTSVRAFENRLVPESVLAEILEAGRLAPSGGNEQSWMFGVVRDRGLIESIADAAYGQRWIAMAPLLIVLCVTPVADERGGRDIQVMRYPGYEDACRSMDRELYSALNQEEHQTKIAGAHMALVALEHGVGSCWVSRFDVFRVAALLGLPDSAMPAEILVMGYDAADDQRSTPKKPLEEVVFYDVHT